MYTYKTKINILHLKESSASFYIAEIPLGVGGGGQSPMAGTTLLWYIEEEIRSLRKLK